MQNKLEITEELPFIEGVKASDEWYNMQHLFHFCYNNDLDSLGPFKISFSKTDSAYYCVFTYEDISILEIQYYNYKYKVSLDYNSPKSENGDWCTEVLKFYKLESKKIEKEKTAKKIKNKKILDSYWSKNK